MEEGELEKLKDRVLFDFQAEGKDKEEIREDLFVHLYKTIRNLHFEENLDENYEEVREMLEAVIEIDDLLKADGLKSAED